MSPCWLRKTAICVIWKIGQQLSWTVNDAGDLQQLTWEVSRRETRTYDRVGNSFKESKEAQQGNGATT